MNKCTFDVYNENSSKYVKKRWSCTNIKQEIQSSVAIMFMMMLLLMTMQQKAILKAAQMIIMQWKVILKAAQRITVDTLTRNNK